MERRVVRRVASIDAGSTIKKRLDALMVAVVCRQMKRSAVVGGTSIDIGTVIEKELDALKVPVACGEMKGGALVGGTSVDVSLSIKKGLHVGQRALRGSCKERIVELRRCHWLWLVGRREGQRATTNEIGIVVDVDDCC